MKFSLFVLTFLLEIIIYSTADDWSDLKKKLIALSILNGLRPSRKQIMVPIPLPLPLPFLLSKLQQTVQQTVAENEKKFPFIVPRQALPVFQFIPNFLPIEQKTPKQFSPPDYAAQESQLYPQFQVPNHGWAHTGWPHEPLYASSANMPLPDMHPFYDSDQQEWAIESMRQRKKANKYRFGDEDTQDDYRHCQQQSKKEADIIEKKDKTTTTKPLTRQSEKRNYRTNRSMSKLYDNYDNSAQLDTAQSVHYDEFNDYNFDQTFGHPLNSGDLLMSSTDSVKSKNSYNNNNNDRQSNSRIGTIRSATNFDAKDKPSTSSGNGRTPQANKFKDGLPVTADEIKGILIDLKTLNDEIKVIPSGQVFARDPPLVNTGVKRVHVGEIRIIPKQLRSLITSGSRMAVDKRQ